MEDKTRMMRCLKCNKDAKIPELELNDEDLGWIYVGIRPCVLSSRYDNLCNVLCNRCAKKITVAEFDIALKAKQLLRKM